MPVSGRAAPSSLRSVLGSSASSPSEPRPGQERAQELGSWGKLQEKEATGGKAEAGVKWPPGKDKFAFPRCRELNLLEKLPRKTLRKVVEAADFWDELGAAGGYLEGDRDVKFFL